MIEKRFGAQGIFMIARHLLEILVICLCVEHSIKVEIVFIYIGCPFLFHVYELVHLFAREKNTLWVASCCLFIFA
jgi:hypothetical protein